MSVTILRRLLKLAGSLNLALALIGLLTLAVVAGGTLPQFSRLSPDELNSLQTQWPLLSLWLERSGLAGVYSSWWFLTLCFLLLVNLLVGTAWHIMYIRAWLKGEAAPSYRVAAAGLPPAGISSQFHIVSDKLAVQNSIRGTAGLWGTPMFHFGIAVIIVAAALSGSERFGAHLELSEGEIFSGQKNKLREDKFSSGETDEFGSMRLDSLMAQIAGDERIRELQAHFTIQEKNTAAHQEVLSDNNPLKIGKYKFYLDKYFGYSASFDRILADGARRKLLINFMVPRSKWGRGEPILRDKLIELEDNPVFYRMTLTPGENPSFQLTAELRGKVIFEGTLLPGQEANLGPYRLAFNGAVPWLGLYMTTDWAVRWVFVGIVIALAGFLLHLLVRPRRLQLTQSNGGWELLGWRLRDDWRFEKQWREWQEAARENKK